MKPTKKMLMIDDDDINNFLVSEWVKTHQPNIEIVIKNEVSSAVQYLKTCEADNFPDIIVCDLVMPGIDGFDFLNVYQTLFFQNNILTRIIILSSNIAEHDRIRLNEFAFLTAILVKKTAQENLEHIKLNYL